MKRTEANELLDEHKNGIRIHPIVEVTKALWLTGDLRGNPKPPGENGKNTGVERTCLVQGERT